MTNAQIIEVVNNIPACFAYEQTATKVEVTYRGKKTDKVYIDSEKSTVAFSGKAENIAIEIANVLNYKMAQ